MKPGQRFGICCLVAACMATGALAQNTGISFSVGGAGFRMDDLKYLQENILNSYPVEGAITSSFPPYVSFSAGVQHKFFPTLRAGIGYTYTSTGGRANYSDYSGEIYTNMTAVSHRLGASAYYSIIGTDRLDLSLFGKLEANLTHLDVTSGIYVLGISNGISNQYRSVSPSGSAGLEFLYKFKEIYLGIEGGYLVDMPGNLTNRESGSELLDPLDPRRNLNADWTGWRVGIKGIIWINREQ